MHPKPSSGVPTLRLAVAAVLACGCARGPNVGSDDLPLRRVVVYRNGVGYFERAGHVDEERVSFRMRQRMVGDFLASLAVIERGGSSVRSASFPLELADAKRPAPAGLLSPEARNGGPPGPPAPPEPAEPDPEAMREVVLHLDGDEHDLAIGYLAETPVWRPSYRVVVQEDGSADLQAWGIVQNLSGEDWSGVTLSLVAGAPLAFQSTLGNPIVPQRPLVTDQGEVISAVPTGVTSLDQKPEEPVERFGPEEGYGAAAAAESVAAQDAGSDPEAAREADEEKAAAPKAAVGSTAAARTRRGNSSAPTPAPAAPPPPALPAGNPSPPRRLADLAAVALEAGSTRYDIPYRVTVPNESATMVLLSSGRVPGGAVLLFAPDGGVSDSQLHPFRVARFTNSTPGLLERGPIAVFERGSFLGQGMLDPLPPRATATVPFALERSVALSRDTRLDQQGARLFHIEASRIWVERDQVLRTSYRIDNGSDRQHRLLVKHGRAAGTRLFKAAPATEDNPASGHALVPVDLRPRGKTELTVDERRAVQQETDWLDPLADDAVRSYLADPRANPELRTKLGDAWKLRTDLRRSLDELQQLAKEQEQLQSSADETRRNLRAIEKNPQAADLRAKLTKRLGEVATRLDAVSKRSIEVQMTSGEQQIRFRDAIQDLRLAAPLPPQD